MMSIISFNGKKILFSLLFFLSLVLHAQEAGDFKLPDLKMEGISLKQAFQLIESKSEYRFIYNDAAIDVSRTVNKNYSGKTIESVLDDLLQGSDIAYEMDGNRVILKKDEMKENLPKRNIKGTINDDKGEALPGVNVVIKGTTNGTITDINGHFTLTVDESDILLISFIGFENQEIAVEGKTNLSVTLIPDVKDIDEVVVVGFGTSSKKLLTGSVSSVSSKEIGETVGVGIEGALQGRTSGVQITQNSGTPGGAMTIKIRGTASVFSGTQPLYVVDGIPITTGNFGQIGFEGQGIDATSDLNPSDIESISILKDASAAAIYGARAANGVILITTKKGQSGKSTINFSGYTGFQKEWKRLKLLNAAEWKDYVSTFDPGFVAQLDPNIDTDWQDEVFRVAPVNNYELSFRGGSNQTKMYASAGYLNQQGIVLGSSYKKYSGRLNIDHNLNDKLSFSGRTGLNFSDNHRIVGDQTINGVLPNAISKPPVYAVKDSLGNYLEEGFWDNPVANGNEALNQARTFRNITGLDLGYRIFPDLSIKYQLGIDFYNLHERRYEPTTTKRGANSNGIGIDARSEVLKLSHQLFADYTRTFGENTIQILAGISAEDITERYSWLRGINFASNKLQYLNTAAIIEEASSSKDGQRINSGFSRVKINFRNRYIAEASIRRDGSSIFGKNNQYAWLPSASFAYRLNEEAFLKNIWFLSELKFKIGFGLTGNDQIPNHRTLNLYSGGANYYGEPGIIPRQIPNDNLRWETSRNVNMGIDLGLFDEKLTFNVEFYSIYTFDLLMPRPIPGSSGFTSYWENIGDISNRGMDFQLGTKLGNDNFRYEVSANISLNRNKVVKLYNSQSFTDEGRGGNAVIEGKPIGVFYMYKSLGVDPSTGDLVFEDLNDDGEYTDVDRQIVGDPNPDFTGGIINTFFWKGFDIKVFFQYSYGNDIFNGTRQYAEAMKFGINDNQLATIKDRWQKPGDITYVPRNDGTYNNSPLSSHYLEDGSYLRLKELSIGFIFPEQWMKNKKMIQSVRLYLQSQNLWTLTPYSGLDPEVNYSGSSSNLVQGTDFFTFPLARTIVFGFNVQF